VNRPLNTKYFFTFQSDKDVPPKADGRGRASKRGQELAEPVVEKNASSPSKRKGRSSDAEVPPKKINSAGTFLSLELLSVNPTPTILT
jgi:hypothetical protein